jgi:HK97 family phage prohead protease
MSEFLRAVALDDIHIRAGGDGRTVEAYAAIFDDLAEIVDADGHYMERNSPAAFNKTIADRGGRFPVVYHHGLTIAGTPSERGSVPIGASIEVRADKRGVLTVARYHKTELADEVLESIRSGAVNAQSYAGRFLKSDPRTPRGGFRPMPDGSLRSVTRLEIAMREFGPTPFPAYAGAAITGVRAQQLLGTLLTAPAEKVHEFLAQFDGSTTPQAEPETPPADTSEDAEAVEPTDEPGDHSARSLRSHIRAARIARGMESTPHDHPSG